MHRAAATGTLYCLATRHLVYIYLLYEIARKYLPSRHQQVTLVE